MGLLYSRKLFAQAGLDPDHPPATWDEVRADAKKIAALGDGIVGYADYSASNQRRLALHHRAVLPGRRHGDAGRQEGGVRQPAGPRRAAEPPGDALDRRQHGQQAAPADVRRAADDGPRASSACTCPRRTTSPRSSTSSRASAPTTASAPMPGAQGTLIGGDGYMFNPKATPDQIKAGILWLEFENLTPGKGQFDWARRRSTRRSACRSPTLHRRARRQGAQGQDRERQRAGRATTRPSRRATRSCGSGSSRRTPSRSTRSSNVVSAVLTKRDADIDQLLAEAATKVDSILANAE